MSPRWGRRPGGVGTRARRRRGRRGRRPSKRTWAINTPITNQVRKTRPDCPGPLLWPAPPWVPCAAAPAFASPPGRRLHLGDIVVSVERAVEQAAAGRGGQTGDVRWSAADELRLLVTHGALHICGWDHAEPVEEAAMRALERRLLGRPRGRHRPAGRGAAPPASLLPSLRALPDGIGPVRRVLREGRVGS